MFSIGLAILNIFFPEVSHFEQTLSGKVCARRQMWERLLHVFRWHTNPPYYARTADHMYGTTLPSWCKLLAEETRVTKPGGLLFLQLGDVNMQWHPDELIGIGWITLTSVPNQESRAIHIYLKKADSTAKNSVHTSMLEYV